MRTYELGMGGEPVYATVEEPSTVRLFLGSLPSRIYPKSQLKKWVRCPHYSAIRMGVVGLASISNGFELSRRVIIGPKER